MQIILIILLDKQTSQYSTIHKYVCINHIFKEKLKLYK